MTLRTGNNADQKSTNTKWILSVLIRYQGGIPKMAEQAGLSKELDIRLVKKEMIKKGPIIYFIITSTQLGW